MSETYIQPALFPESDVPQPGQEGSIAIRGLKALSHGLERSPLVITPEAAAREQIHDEYLGEVVAHNLDPRGQHGPDRMPPANLQEQRRALAVQRQLQKVADARELQRSTWAVMGRSGHYAPLKTRRARMAAKDELRDKHAKGELTDAELAQGLQSADNTFVYKLHRQEKAEKRVKKTEEQARRYVGYPDETKVYGRPPTYVQDELMPARDELLDEAIHIVATTQHASPATLIRHMGVPLEHARTLINIMESKGLVGPENKGGLYGPDPRKVYIPKPPKEERDKGRGRERRHNDRETERDAEYWHQKLTKVHDYITSAHPEYSQLFEEKELEALDVGRAVAITKAVRQRKKDDHVPSDQDLPTLVFNKVRDKAKDSFLSTYLKDNTPKGETLPDAIEPNIKRALNYLAREHGRIPLYDDLEEDDDSEEDNH